MATDVFTSVAPSLPCMYHSSMTACEASGCGATFKLRKGLCNRHYLRMRRHGSPYGGGIDRPKFDSPKEEFEQRTVTTWHGLEWIGPIDFPYGRMRDGRYAHRFAWEQAHGPIPHGWVIDHQPECPKTCVQKEHLTAYSRDQHSSVGWERGELDGGWIRAGRHPTFQDPRTGRFVRGNVSL